MESNGKLPLNIVGSSVFGAYPKISIEKTYNMFISDGWLVNFAGWKKLNSITEGLQGRALFHSIRGNLLVAVIDDNVYRINPSLSATLIGKIDSNIGEVIIDENLSSQICIVDGVSAYIYNYEIEVIEKQSIGIFPGYVTYHNTFFLIAPTKTSPTNNSWRVFQRETDTTIEQLALGKFPVATKPDVALAVKRLPGKSNHVMVFGESVCEVWTQIGGDEIYRRNSSFNIDNGCISKFTIAGSEEVLCWLSINENNAPSLMVTNGSSSQRISTDGFDVLLQTIKRPQESTAFFFRQDGHLFYVLTFYSDLDDISLAYDFTTQKFFNLTDENMRHHPARQVAYYSGRAIFVGLDFGAIYEMSTKITGAIQNVDSEEIDDIPRIRITSTTRDAASSRFRINKLTFTIEQGVNSFPLGAVGVDSCIGLYESDDGSLYVTETGINYISSDGSCIADSNALMPAVDLSISKNGNQSFTSIVRRRLNPQGKYRNELHWWRMGFCNEATFQIRFWGMQRFVASDGVLDVY